MMQESEHQGGPKMPNPIPVEEKPSPPPVPPQTSRRLDEVSDGPQETSED